MDTSIIVLLKSDSLDEVLILIKESIIEMKKNGIEQWDEVYPDDSVISLDISNQTMYGLYNDQKLCAILVLNNIQSPLYKSIKWEFSDENTLVIHRLCVHPEFQNKGIAKKLVNFAEQFARNNHYKTIRLDAFTKNPFAEKLYRKMEYIERGTMKARKGDFYCFEKNII